MTGRGGPRWWSAVLCTALLCSGGGLLAGCAAPATTSAAASSTPISAEAGSAEPGPGSSNGADSSVAGGTTAPALPECDSGNLRSVAPGMLTVATGSTPTSPWFVGDSPTTGQGLESAMAYAVAEALGYSRDQVSWIIVDPAQAESGVAVGFDLDFDQFTAPDIGTPTADYSTGYFPVTDAVLVRQAATPPTSLAELKDLRLGVVGPVGDSPSVPTTSPGATTAGPPFADHSDALAGLTSGTIDAVILPIPTALAAAASDPTVVLAGQLPADPSVQPDQFKVLLPKDSALTGCVSAAVDRLRVEGTLEMFAKQWIEPLAPILR